MEFRKKHLDRQKIKMFQKLFQSFCAYFALMYIFPKKL